MVTSFWHFAGEFLSGLKGGGKKTERGRENHFPKFASQEQRGARERRKWRGERDFESAPVCTPSSSRLCHCHHRHPTKLEMEEELEKRGS